MGAGIVSLSGCDGGIETTPTGDADEMTEEEQEEEDASEAAAAGEEEGGGGAE